MKNYVHDADPTNPTKVILNKIIEHTTQPLKHTIIARNECYSSTYPDTGTQVYDTETFGLEKNILDYLTWKAHAVIHCLVYIYTSTMLARYIAIFLIVFQNKRRFGSKSGLV